MNDQERIENARKQITKLVPEGTKLYVIRIDEGRKSGIPYFAILCNTDTGLQNISGHVARLIGRKWANVNWANASGVQSRNATDLIERLATELHGLEKQLKGNQTITFDQL